MCKLNPETNLIGAAMATTTNKPQQPKGRGTATESRADWIVTGTDTPQVWRTGGGSWRGAEGGAVAASPVTEGHVSATIAPLEGSTTTTALPLEGSISSTLPVERVEFSASPEDRSIAISPSGDERREE